MPWSVTEVCVTLCGCPVVTAGTGGLGVLNETSEPSVVPEAFVATTR